MINKIILKDVKKEYENFQLGELSFAIPKGYITGFIGKNGQGKTTTIKSILSFINFEGGILVDDSSNLKLDFLQRTGIVMDEPLLAKDWNMTIVNKAMAIGYEDWDTERFFNFLKRFGIPLKSKVADLSRGMKIKLMLSIALSHNANLLILDEPTSGLDPGSRDEFADIIQEFVEEEENTVLFSTHITQDLEAIADYIIFIDDGKLIEFKSKEDFLNTYKVIKGSPSEFEKIDSNIILGSKRSSVAFEALIRSEEEYNISSDIICENATIENIMVLYGREEMKDISKIIKIDMLSIYPYLTLKNFIIILVMGLFYPLINKNTYTIYGLTQFFAILYCSYPFLVGDESGIDALYGAFAIERKKVVYGRYIWSNLVILIFLIIAIILSGIVSILINEVINVEELIYLVSIVFIISNLIIAGQYPFYFKYGYGKSKIIMTSMFFIIAILGFIIVYFKDFLIKNMEFLFNNINLLIFGSLLFFTILYLSSIIVSIKVYKNRELN